MKRFDLTFRGDILPDYEPGQVRRGFADLFRISDPLVLDELFSGDAFVLRSNLDRKSAADYFRKISQLGGRAELVPREIPGERAAETGVAAQVLTRIQETDPSVFVAPGRRSAEHDETFPAPTTIDSEGEGESGRAPSQVDRPDHRAKTPVPGPSPEEILARLQGLQQDAETAHQSKLEQLEQLLAEVKEETAQTLEQIRLQREQVLIDAQDEMTRLEELEASGRQQHEADLALLAREEEEQTRRLHKDMKRLEKKHRNKCSSAVSAGEQLQADRESRQQQAAATIASLEAQIAETRRQCEEDIVEIDRLLSKTEHDLAQFELEFGQQTQSLQASQAQALDHLQVKRQEYVQQFEADREELVTLQQQNENHREEQLTGLWEREEKSQHAAQERLQQLESTRKRHEQSLQQRLQRLKEEEVKLRRG